MQTASKTSGGDQTFKNIFKATNLTDEQTKQYKQILAILLQFYFQIAQKHACALIHQLTHKCCSKTTYSSCSKRTVLDVQ